MTSPAPRLYALVAAAAPVAVVFRRGPTEWWHVGRWDLRTGGYEPGAWLHGRLYPRRSDLSPDGDLLLAFVMKRTGPGFLDERAYPDTYVTVSRTPWLYALAAWRYGTTWGKGYCFTDVPQPEERNVLGEAEAGDARPLRGRYGIDHHAVMPFAAERLRGWTDQGHDAPDGQRGLTMVKHRPKGPGTLLMWASHAEVVGGSFEDRAPSYALADPAGEQAAIDVAWADWTPDGHLAVATFAGSLELRDPDRGFEAMSVHDLSSLAPNPQPSPDWAQAWRPPRHRRKPPPPRRPPAPG